MKHGEIDLNANCGPVDLPNCSNQYYHCKCIVENLERALIEANIIHIKK